MSLEHSKNIGPTPNNHEIGRLRSGLNEAYKNILRLWGQYRACLGSISGLWLYRAMRGQQPAMPYFWLSRNGTTMRDFSYTHNSWAANLKNRYRPTEAPSKVYNNPVKHWTKTLNIITFDAAHDRTYDFIFRAFVSLLSLSFLFPFMCL
jgi:hypothetical protein